MHKTNTLIHKMNEYAGTFVWGFYHWQYKSILTLASVSAAWCHFLMRGFPFGVVFDVQSMQILPLS